MGALKSHDGERLPMVWTLALPVGNLCATMPTVFSLHDGMLEGGHDVSDCRTMNIEDAKAYAATLPGCVGFTYQQVGCCCSPQTIFFKTRWIIHQNPHGTVWKSWQMHRTCC